MVYPHVADEYDEAMAPQVSTFHGQITTAAFKVAWPKGDFKGRQVYDAEIHKGDNWQSSTMVNLTITPLDPTRKMITREVPTFAREFSGVIRPSLEALVAKIAAIKGIDPKACNPLREIDKLWVAGEFVPRSDNKPGETWTTLKIVDVFATEAKCQAHAGATPNGEAQPSLADTIPPAQNDTQRKALALFLPTLWNQAHRNMDEFRALLQANPLLSSTFTLDSPEVKEVCVP